MSGISTNSAHICTYHDSAGDEAIMNVNLTMNGCGISISLVDLRREQFHICRNKWGEVHLVAIPSAKWVQDMKDDGWEILHTIDNKRIDPKPAVTAQAPLAPNPQ